jgi:signal transduction histidine kinase
MKPKIRKSTAVEVSGANASPKGSNRLMKILEQREALLETKQCMGCMHEGMLVTDMDGTIQEVAPAAEHILDTPSLNLIGEAIQSFCVAPDAYDEIGRQAVRDGRVSNRSLLMSAGSGKRKLVRLSIQVSGQVSGNDDNRQLVHVFQDCADLQSMEERLLQSERLATVGRFASQIAHEIRNPLNSISLNVELLEDEVSSNEEARGLIRSVLKELDRLNDIVSEYLQFSRFPKPHLKRGRVESVIRELADSFKSPDRISFHVQLAPSTPEVWLDEGLLRQVLDNLIRNAVEAITGTGAVDIETDVLDHYVVIRVKDSGIGIPADSQTRLFEPFFTTKAQGTGLGLATSQQIIFEHNGHLLVESQPGKGSIFSILLPV